MPHRAQHDQDLLDEAWRHLGAAAGLIADGTLGDLVQAQGRIDTAVSVLSDALGITTQEWVDAQARCASVLMDWERACRGKAVRAKLLRAIAPGAGAPGAPTLWVIQGFGKHPLGDIALASFSAAGPGSDCGEGSRTHHVLWGPGWLLEQLVKNDLVRVAVVGEVPATQAEAEVAATLVEPGNPESAYQDIRAAHRAAQAVLAV